MPTSTTRRWFTAAAVAGTLHAIASIYWGLGGSWLVDTVGQWAEEWREKAPVLSSAALLLIGAAKLAGAWVPLVNDRRPLSGARVWRVLSWVGATVLVVYGGLNTIAANVALTGVFGPLPDVMATRGHAWLWDPLFFIWGASLLVGLRRGRLRDLPRTSG